jgi:hypothetical protein
MSLTIRILKGEKKVDGTKKVLSGIVIENLSNLAKDINTQIVKTEQTSAGKT